MSTLISCGMGQDLKPRCASFPVCTGALVTVRMRCPASSCTKAGSSRGGRWGCGSRNLGPTSSARLGAKGGRWVPGWPPDPARAGSFPALGPSLLSAQKPGVAHPGRPSGTGRQGRCFLYAGLRRRLGRSDLKAGQLGSPEPPRSGRTGCPSRGAAPLRGVRGGRPHPRGSRRSLPSWPALSVGRGGQARHTGARTAPPTAANLGPPASGRSPAGSGGALPSGRGPAPSGARAAPLGPLSASLPAG